MTIRYDQIFLYAKPAQATSAAIRRWLDAEGIAYTNLDFPDPTETLAALSTWFHDEDDNPIVFTDTPVLIYDQVLWESEDKSDSYRKRKYVTNTSDLPSDFATLAEQVS